MAIRPAVLRTTSTLLEKGLSRTPLREVALTQLPYIIPGAARVIAGLDSARTSHAGALGAPKLSGTLGLSTRLVDSRCPLCQAEQVRVRYRPVRHDDAGQVLWSYHVGQCPECGMLYRVPAIDKEDVAALYNSGGYANYLQGEYAKTRRRRYRATLQAFSPHFDVGNGRTLLDFGCGTGLFMRMARKRGFDPYGLDLAPDSVTIAQQEFGENHVVCGTPTDLRRVAPVKFDVITMWSVLAHIPDPKEQLSELRDMLSPGGVLLILTVNANSLQRKTFAGRWNGFTPGHLMFWSSETLRRLLGETGFDNIAFADFHGEAIETNKTRLSPRQAERYQATVRAYGGGNMLRAIATN